LSRTRRVTRDNARTCVANRDERLSGSLTNVHHLFLGSLLPFRQAPPLIMALAERTGVALEATSTEPAKKKRKVNADMPSTSTKSRARKGKLATLPTVSLDILYEVRRDFYILTRS
jgi:hypothetical protein